jgi:threonine/homoserine/homoserine lactone efflux protein
MLVIREGDDVDISFALRGLLLGFSIAAPVGPIGLLCIRRTLADGRLSGLATGLGAATADGLYGAIAAFGLTAVSSFLLGQRMWVHLVGGAFLLYLGLRIELAGPPDKAAVVRRSGLSGAYASTVLLTLSNPTTILSFVAAFAAFGVAGTRGSALSAGLITLGVFCGSALWWLILSGSVSALRTRMTSGALLWINRASGLLIVGFAVVSLVSARG